MRRGRARALSMKVLFSARDALGNRFFFLGAIIIGLALSFAEKVHIEFIPMVGQLAIIVLSAVLQETDRKPFRRGIRLPLAKFGLNLALVAVCFFVGLVFDAIVTSPTWGLNEDVLKHNVTFFTAIGKEAGPWELFWTVAICAVVAFLIAIWCARATRALKRNSVNGDRTVFLICLLSLSSFTIYLTVTRPWHLANGEDAHPAVLALLFAAQLFVLTYVGWFFGNEATRGRIKAPSITVDAVWGALKDLLNHRNIALVLLTLALMAFDQTEFNAAALLEQYKLLFFTNLPDWMHGAWAVALALVFVAIVYFWIGLARTLGERFDNSRGVEALAPLDPAEAPDSNDNPDGPGLPPDEPEEPKRRWVMALAVLALLLFLAACLRYADAIFNSLSGQAPPAPIAAETLPVAYPPVPLRVVETQGSAVQAAPPCAVPHVVAFGRNKTTLSESMFASLKEALSQEDGCALRIFVRAGNDTNATSPGTNYETRKKGIADRVRELGAPSPLIEKAADSQEPAQTK